MERQYIITVPALWDYNEQEKTRSCAERADMGRGSEITLIPESEAAGIWAIKKMLSIEKGDTFVVCDAGGGYVYFSKMVANWANWRTKKLMVDAYAHSPIERLTSPLSESSLYRKIGITVNWSEQERARGDFAAACF